MQPGKLIQNHDGGITCHIGHVPPHIDEILVQTYASLHSSLAFFRVFRSIGNASCYLARRAGLVSTVLVFTCHGRRLEVINEMFELEQAELLRFVQFIFTHLPHIDVISFRALNTTTDQLRLPLQQYRAKGTYVIALPDTPEAYIARIGKSTRASIRQGLNGIQRQFPSFQSLFFDSGDIDDTMLRAIIALSERRIAAGGAAFSHDVERIIELSRQCGFMSVILIGGRLCAGSVNYRVGTSYFGDVMGFDPQYEKYGLGKLCVYLTVCESIRRGGTAFYLGGGVFAFKERLLGVPLDMDALHVYRSPMALLRNIDHAAVTAFGAGTVHVKNLLHRHKHTGWGRFVFRSFYVVQNLMSTFRWGRRSPTDTPVQRDK